MAFWLTEGAMLECTMGLTPSPLNVLPVSMVTANAMPVATIIDNVPFVNIIPFGLCKSPANPAVAAIIASSLGAVTQGPCLPETPAPWIPASPQIMAGEMPCIDQTSKLMCVYGGVISPIVPGQFCVIVP